MKNHTEILNTGTVPFSRFIYWPTCSILLLIDVSQTLQLSEVYVIDWLRPLWHKSLSKWSQSFHFETTVTYIWLNWKCIYIIIPSLHVPSLCIHKGNFLSLSLSFTGDRHFNNIPLRHDAIFIMINSYFKYSHPIQHVLQVMLRATSIASLVYYDEHIITSHTGNKLVDKKWSKKNLVYQNKKVVTSF